MKDYSALVPHYLIRDYIKITEMIDAARPLALIPGGDGSAYVKAHRLRAKVHDEILAHVGVDRDNEDFAMWLYIKTEAALRYPHLDELACPAN